MDIKQINVLKVIEKNEYISQRNLSKKLKLSLGSINGILSELHKNQYILKNMHKNNKISYKLLEKGKKEIDKTYVKTAVILAAGMGTRLYSVTNNEIPKGFLNVFGDTLIERSVKILLNNSIEKIIIVTGHLNSYFDALKEKYPMIETIKNNNYANTGSMSSLAKASEIIQQDEFLLLESDLIYEKKAIEYLQFTHKKDCILLSGKTNSGDEVYIEVKDNNIYKMSKDKHSLKKIYGELVGISKISRELLQKMIVEYEKSTNEQYHYEYAIEDSAKKYLVGYKKIDDLIWGEIDDAAHLKRINDIVIPKLTMKGEE